MPRGRSSRMEGVLVMINTVVREWLLSKTSEGSEGARRPGGKQVQEPRQDVQGDVGGKAEKPVWPQQGSRGEGVGDEVRQRMAELALRLSALDSEG